MGALLSHLGAIAAAAIHFWVARHLAYELVARLVGDRHRQIERLLARQGFWALVRLRFVPIPYLLANVGCALAGARPGPFLLTTTLAMAPVMLVWSYFADALFASTAGSWGGPIRSGYGRHIVRIDTLEPSRVPALEEIEADVRAAWTDERYREIRQRAAEEMRARYTVVIPPFDPAELVELGAPTASAGGLLQ